MTKLSSLKLVENRNQIKDNDFVVILSLSHWEISSGNQNKITYNGKDYTLVIMKGLLKNLLKISRDLRADEQYKDYEIVIAGKMGQNIELLAYKDFQSMIDECSVYSHPQKVEIDVDEDAIIYCLEHKTKMYHPSHN